MGEKQGEGESDAPAPPAANVLDFRSVPSPRHSGMRRRKGRGEEAWVEEELDWREVEKLAAYGLSMEEVLVKLEWEGAVPPSLKLRLEAAIKKGKALGVAEIKEAQYRAAVDGRVVAQPRALDLLEDGEVEDNVVYEVERVIIGGEEDDDQEN